LSLRIAVGIITLVFSIHDSTEEAIRKMIEPSQRMLRIKAKEKN
jgi:hypothetical protein